MMAPATRKGVHTLADFDDSGANKAKKTKALATSKKVKTLAEIADEEIGADDNFMVRIAPFNQ